MEVESFLNETGLVWIAEQMRWSRIVIASSVLKYGSVFEMFMETDDNLDAKFTLKRYNHTIRSSQVTGYETAH